MTIRSRTAFIERLNQASYWTPELRNYAASYLLSHTTMASIYEVLDAAGLTPPLRSVFKTDKVQLLLDNRPPRAVAAAWDAWRHQRRRSR